MAKILVVEDDSQLADVVKSALIFEHHSVELLQDGRIAQQSLKVSHYDLIILDVGLPGLSGFEICRDFREGGGKTPVLMLTGQGAISDKERGFDSGTDDYLTKPFNVKELCLRVRALLRRSTAVKDDVLRAGDISLDPQKHKVWRAGAQVPLVPKEFALLEFLMRHPNQVFATEALLSRVWPSDCEADVSAVRSTVKRLRKKLDPDGVVLRTEYGIGYSLDVSSCD